MSWLASALITPAVVPKKHTLFEMIFWNNCAWLNTGMCCAVLNVEHFEGQFVWLSFNINFYKDGSPPAPPCVHQCLYHICIHRGRGDYHGWGHHHSSFNKVIHHNELQRGGHSRFHLRHCTSCNKSERLSLSPSRSDLSDIPLLAE